MRTVLWRPGASVTSLVLITRLSCAAVTGSLIRTTANTSSPSVWARGASRSHTMEAAYVRILIPVVHADTCG